MTNTTEFRCLSCDATPSAREMTDGWCDSCGKRLPDSYAAKAKNSDPLKTRPEPGTRTRLGGCALPALLAIGVVTVIGVILV